MPMTKSHSVALSQSPVRWWITLIVTVAAWLSRIAPAAAQPADAEDAANAVEHPFVVVAAASIDRVKERAATLLKAAGGDASLVALQRVLSADDGVRFLAGIKGIDTTRPIGVLVFLGFSTIQPNPADEQPKDLPVNTDADSKATSDKKPSGEPDVFDRFLDSIDPERFVFAIPLKDFDEFLASLGLTPVPDEPHQYKDSLGIIVDVGGIVSVRRSGDYAFFAGQPDLLAHSADPCALIHSVLGQNDVAVSFQARGLPIGMRTLIAEGLKSGFAASLQQQPDEPKLDYQLRRVVGDLSLELIDLALTQIDEVNLGLRLDPDKCELLTEFELVGIKDGKLAKFAAEITPKRSPFAGLLNTDGPCSFGLSLALPKRHSKPLAEGLSDYLLALEGSDLLLAGAFFPITEPGVRLIEAGQFDLAFMTPKDGETGVTLMAMKAPGGPNFPKKFQLMMEFFQKTKLLQSMELAEDIKIAVDTVNDWPIHKLSLASGWNKSWCELWPELGMNVNEAEGGSLYVAATPDAIWFGGSSGKEQQGVSKAFKSAIEQTVLAVTRPETTDSSGPAVLRLSLHTREWQLSQNVTGNPDDEKDAKVRQTLLKQIEDEKKKRKVVQTFFQKKGDGIHADLRPTETGLRLTVKIEEACLAWLIHLAYEDLVHEVSSKEKSDASESNK